MNMSNLIINVAQDFSDAPGARYIEDGDSSGEEFYIKLLRDKFQEALDKKVKLIVDLDGTYGYATSFISEAFGSLSNDFGPETVLKNIEIKSDEDTRLKDYTIQLIKDPNSK
jgi:hypothetical protein